MAGKGTAAARAEREARVQALWKRRELAPWAAALEAAPARAAKSSAGPRLSAKPELDRFYYEELPKQLLLASSSSCSSSVDHHHRSRHSLSALTAAQLARVVEWKLARGTWRPRLLDFARAAKQADVAAAAAAAAKALESGGGGGGGGNLGAAVDALCVLRGVGPATATALLSAADPSIPFLSDEAGVAVLGAREYTRPAALRVTGALRERAEELSEKQQKDEEKGVSPPSSSSIDWTASKVERALWSASRAEEEDDAEEAEEMEEEKGTGENKGGQEEAKKDKKKRKLG